MQADAFADEKMKVLYALSFMCGGMAQVWAVNETMAVITGTSQMQTLDIFLESVEKAFGDPDQAQTARAQLHELRMTPGTMAEDYTARFEMLAGRTGFNDATLEDIYVRGLSPHTSRLTHRHRIPPLLWMSTYRRHNLKLGSATTARKLDISRTTAQNPASSGPEMTFRERTSQILSPKP